MLNESCRRPARTVQDEPDPRALQAATKTLWKR
jgi:hypothetical protein